MRRAGSMNSLGSRTTLASYDSDYQGYFAQPSFPPGAAPLKLLKPKKVKKMAKKFDKLLEKATAPTLLEPDWEGILNCVDAIRSGDVPAKPAMASIKKRFQSENPQVALYALMVLDASVKNCGEKVYKEIATKDFMEDLKHAGMESGGKVKEKVLELVQCWAHAFRSKTQYNIVLDTHNLMKLEGFEFPTMREADAMFSAESAPDWVEGEACWGCRAGFGLLKRKHHCRACGQIFCDKCTRKSLILPHIGIEKEVRVCESCYDKFKARRSSSSRSLYKDRRDPTGRDEDSAGSSKKSDSAEAQGGGKEKEEEEEELAMAIALSQSEADEKERQRQRLLMQFYNGPDSMEASADEFYPSKKEPTRTIRYKGGVLDSATNGIESPSVAQQSRPSWVNKSAGTGRGLDRTDPELERYLNGAYWETRRTEQKQGTLRQSPTPTAPQPSESATALALNSEQPSLTNISNGVESGSGGGKMGQEAVESSPPPGGDQALNGVQATQDGSARFVCALKCQVEVFVNRIRSNQGRGRSIVNDSSIQTLFLSLTNYHAHLLNRIHNLDEKRSYFESLQDRLSSMEEAREAVEALREEEERRREEELMETQRLRQIQMQQKLEVMRHKKHEMLEHQRMMGLQRMQEQEREIQMRRHTAPMALALAPYQPQPGDIHQSGTFPTQHHIPCQMVSSHHGYGMPQGVPQAWTPVQTQPQMTPQQVHYDQQRGYTTQQVMGQGYALPPQGYAPGMVQEDQPAFYQQPQAHTDPMAYHIPQQVAAAQPTYVYQQPLPQRSFVPQQVIAQGRDMNVPQPQQEIYHNPSPQTHPEQKQEDLLISFD